MHELLNVRTNKVISFPSDIDELTPSQYLVYLDLVLQQFTGAISDPMEIKRKLFVALTDLKVSKKMAFYTADEEENIWAALTEKINLLDSFFDIEDDSENKVYHLHIKSGVNLLPTWNGLTGPDDMLSNITWGDFVNCLNALKMTSVAQAENDIEEIQRNTLEIFSILYKEPLPDSYRDPKGGQRKTLKSLWRTRNTKHETRNTKHETPDTVLYHALTYFSYVYELITTVPIPINGEEVDFSIIWKADPDNEGDTGDKSGWAGILFSVAETGIFGRSAEVNDTNLYDVLMYLYSRKMQALAEKKKEKNNSNGESN